MRSSESYVPCSTKVCPCRPVLAADETRPDREPSLTIGALREASVWERLSVGLHATFLLWLKYIRSPGTAKSMLVAARRTPKEPRSIFAPIPIDGDTGTRAIQSVRRALDLRDRLEKETPCLAAIQPRSNWATRWSERLPSPTYSRGWKRAMARPRVTMLGSVRADMARN